MPALRLCRAEPTLPPRIRQNAPVARDAPQAGLDQLSRREREIFGRIIQGLSSRDIAQSLCISLKTVETHRSAAMHKVGAKSAADLTLYAARNDLVQL